MNPFSALGAGIGVRIAVYFGALLAAAIASLLAVWFYGLPAFGLQGARDTKLAEAQRALEVVADSRVSRLDAALRERRANLRQLSEAEALADALQAVAARQPRAAGVLRGISERVFPSVMNAYPERYERLLLVSAADSQIVAASESGESIESLQAGRTFDDPDLLQRALKIGVVEHIELADANRSLGKRLVIARQIGERDEQGNPSGKVLGVLLAYMPTGAMLGDIGRAAFQSLGSSGAVLLFDPGGQILASFGNLNDGSGQPFDSLPPQRGIEGGFVETGRDGHPLLVTYRFVRIGGAEGWSLLVRRDLDEALSGIATLAQRMLLLGLLFAVAGLGLVVYAARRISRPIRHLAAVAQRIGDGDLAARVTQRHGRYPDEVTALGETFNAMAAHVQTWHVSLESEVAFRTRALLQEKATVQRYLDVVGVMVLVLDRSGRIALINRKGCELLQRSEQELLGADWFSTCLPENQRRDVRTVFDRLMAGQGEFLAQYENPVLVGEGKERLIGWRNILLRDAAGEIQGVLSSGEDLTERHHSEAQLRLAAKVFECTAEGVMITDTQRLIVAVNPAFSAITGYSPAEVIGRPPRVISSGRHGAEFYDAMAEALTRDDAWQGEVWNRRKNGEIYPEWLTINAARDSQGRLTHYVGVFTDISQVKQSEEKLDYLAHHDPLTGLPNRLLLNDRLAHCIERSQRSGEVLALLFIDLDNFKHVNDSLGHQVGDELLVAVADLVSGHLRAADTLARLGGDEFVLLIENVVDPGEVARVAEKMLDLLREPRLMAGHSLYVTASIGISLYPADGASAAELLQHADSAMYRAKKMGRNGYQFYTQDLTEQAVARLGIESRLREAVDKAQLLVHYQPQVRLPDGKLLGVEALMRWDCPGYGMVPPDLFIPVAEDCGMIQAMGEWVLREACGQLVEWQRRGVEVPCVAVNVSVKQMLHGNFAALVARVLADTGLPPAALELEITESVIADTSSLDVIQALATLGVKLSIDDFGTGYSSLSYLKRLPIHKLKIDKAFIRDIPGDANDTAIVRAVISLADSLGLETIAEGVEQSVQIEFLLAHGCAQAQGFHFSRPVPAAAIAEYCRRASPL